MLNQISEGVCAMSYKPKVSGKYQLHVKLYGKHIKHSPFSVNITPGPVFPPACYIDKPTSQNLAAGETGCLVVFLRDEHNNTVTTGAKVKKEIKLTSS